MKKNLRIIPKLCLCLLCSLLMFGCAVPNEANKQASESGPTASAWKMRLILSQGLDNSGVSIASFPIQPSNIESRENEVSGHRVIILTFKGISPLQLSALRRSMFESGIVEHIDFWQIKADY